MPNEVPRVVQRHVLGSETVREPQRHVMTTARAVQRHAVSGVRAPTRHVIEGGDFYAGDFSSDDFDT